MAKESGENRPDEQFETLLQKKDKRLSKSTRAHIRNLKKEGRLDEANRVRTRSIEGRYQRDQQTLNALDESVTQLLTTDNPKVEIKEGIRIVWLLSKSGQISEIDQRTDEINEIVDATEPELIDYAEQILPQVRDEVTIIV